ncbi:hypothetical protein EES44_16740 [Streptomyces sp. ADI96-15]|uniref:hypothetical protein n=1 Tax=Streptomyces sp. PVA_94-07 TaxID=1225337 RepID=UPI000A5EE731|nr:hypothetical protein EES44_16740 [Streptomyces sp. ADI96-15]
MNVLLWGALPYVAFAWTDAIGVTAHTYHLSSLYGGTLAGAVALTGIALRSTGGAPGPRSSAPPPPATR